jgi:hypothetical protein
VGSYKYKTKGGENMHYKLLKLKKVLNTIEKEDGVITPYRIIEVARPIDSPIHDMFDWDDTSAAEKYRLWQARHYIKVISVTMLGKTTQGFFNVALTIKDVKTQGYYSTTKVLSNEEMRKVVLKDALNKLLYWKQVYKDFSELVELIDERKVKKLEATL